MGVSYYQTREELRSDIREIVTEVTNKIVDESRRGLIKMINEDLAATNKRIDNIDRRMKREFSKINAQIADTNAQLSGTNALLKTRIFEPQAHTRT